MSWEKHILRKKIYGSKWYKWLALILILLILLCLFLKCCEHNVVTNHATIINPLPSDPNRMLPIDNDKVEPVLDDPFDREAVNDLINVYLKESVDIKDYSADIQTQYSSYSLVPTYYADVYKRVQFKVDKEKKNELMLELRKDTSRVKFVTHEWVFRQSFANYSDPGYNDLNNFWFYKNIGLNEAWKITKGDSSIKIAIIDDGFDLNHPELKNQYEKPWNVFKYNDYVYGETENIFHGTHVASTVIGNLNNSFGISGVAPNCKFIPIQISDESGLMTITSILDGIFYALKNNADIINLSLGFSMGEKAKSLSSKEQQEIIENFFKDEEQLWDEVFGLANKDNVIIVQAAGNDNILADVDPMKRTKNSITVGALDRSSSQADFTNFGSSVTVYAPGAGILSALPNKQMGAMDGTSMSSPMVAGCIALIKSYKPEMTSVQIIELITSHSKNSKNNIIRIDQILSLL